MNTHRFLRPMTLIVVAVGMMATSLGAAELRFSRHFGDGMVLQRDKAVPVSGFADKGDTVTVQFAGQIQTATADESGAWTVTFNALAGNSKGQSLSAKSDGETAVLRNVLVGDVFLVARQTSIDISLDSDPAGKKAAANHGKTPLFRAIHIETVPARNPLADLAPEATAGWVEVTSKTAGDLSAAAYYFGRDLAKNQPTAVGLIDLNMGSAFPIAWLSRDSLLESEKIYGKTDVLGNIKRMENLAELVAKGEPRPRKEVIQSDPVKYALYPASGYNAVLHPMKGIALKAALVQLGNDYPYMIYAELQEKGDHLDRAELNRAYVETYNIRKVGFRMEPVTTPRIPREWRRIFGADDLPFGLIAPPGSDLNTLGVHHREMRELQRRTAQASDGVGQILPGTDSVDFSAQPRDEKLLGSRCLSWVQGRVYAQPETPATGPQFERLETNFNRAAIHFKEGTAAGLQDKGNGLENFEAAGIEREYSPVEAEIDGEVIRLKSDTVNRIVHVRYDWSRKPDQDLVNKAGLPALPFRSEEVEYHWFVRNTEDDLPEEYSLPANQWKSGDVTLVNGQLKTHGYPNFSGWLGPVGVKTGPFGPNMGVREVKPGSPAEGKLFEGDVIYSANGTMLGEKAWRVMAAAITDSETREKGGELVLGVRRDGRNRKVTLTLEVMGSYSSTAPYDCPKTEKIIRDLEDWLVSKGADAGFLNTDAIFMLATGNPEMQGYARRAVYSIMPTIDLNKRIDPTGGMRSWYSSANAFLFGEYYLATGDRNALPYLKWFCDRLALTQNPEGGWRHNFPGGPHYGLIPNAGLPGVMGMHFAKQAGVNILESAYRRGLRHFADDRAETGFLIYGFGGCQREAPAPIDPEQMANGKLSSYNGGLSAAGILMRLTGKYRAAHLCSFISAHAWNNTFGGHGGNFWNNFWTPLGANDHGRAAFINFWKNYRWYRECNRMFDGSLIQHENGRVGAGAGVALVAPRQRIQIVGAPKSPFAADGPDYLKPAVEAYYAKDYAKAESLARELLAGGTVAKNERPTVEYLARAAKEIQQSIEADLARMDSLIKEGNPEEAKTFVAGLKGILPEGDERLAAMEKNLAEAKQAEKPAPKKKSAKAADKDVQRDWGCLVNEVATTRSRGKGEYAEGKVASEDANIWRMKVVEDLDQAPEKWTSPKFDDSSWYATALPISWRMYHTALFRTSFDLEDKKAIGGLRFRAWLFRQQGIEIYLNGKLIGKVNNLKKKTGNVMAEFNESAVKHLKNGKNTLAVTSRHNWRWGMLFMKVYNDGFGFRLDAWKKDGKI